MKATLKKIAELMKAQEKLMGMPASDDKPDPSPAEESYKMQIGLLKQELEQFRAKEKQAQLVESINAELAAAGLDSKNPTHVSELFSKTLLATESVDSRKALILDRAGLLKVAPKVSQSTPSYTPPQQSTESVGAAYWGKRLKG
jgi:hypothetical protein